MSDDEPIGKKDDNDINVNDESKQDLIVLKMEDGTEKQYAKGTIAKEIVKDIYGKGESKVLAVKLGQKFLDLSRKIEESGEFKGITFEDSEGKKIFWHSTNHILAQAVKRLYPDAKLGIGPAIEEGFYYDFEVGEPFKPEDLVKIEKEMKKIVDAGLPVERIEMSKEDAIGFNNKSKEQYRNDLLADIEDEVIPYYKQGDFTDMCIGPHVSNTGKIRAFKLLKVSGAYWKGDIRNKQLSRIYGISFPEPAMLADFLKLRQEAEKRDHRKLGKELELFSIHDEGPGFPFFLPKGMIVKNLLVDYWREEHAKEGYVEVQTPIILSKKLWEQSGHWENYRENMYTTVIDDMDFAIKPMNCPGGMLIYNEKVRSYKELPLRMGELGIVHRHELSGVLAGLFRVRVFTQDDAHVFCTSAQLQNEIIAIIDLVDRFYKRFGFTYQVELSTRPEKSIGTDEQWENAEKSLHDALQERGMDFKINEGDGAFYGPKIDFHITDCIGRTWQCATIQVDMALPERFDLNYIGEDNRKHKPVVLHRVIYGSLERFFGILLEHYAGKYPLWLAPVQAKIVTVNDEVVDYAKDVKAQLEGAGLRIELDARSESIGYKVRGAQLQKVPLVLTIGEKEVESKTLAVRDSEGKVKFGMQVEELISKMRKTIKEKTEKLEL